jgi:hypothetical protein
MSARMSLSPFFISLCTFGIGSGLVRPRSWPTYTIVQQTRISPFKLAHVRLSRLARAAYIAILFCHGHDVWPDIVFVLRLQGQELDKIV